MKLKPAGYIERKHRLRKGVKPFVFNIPDLVIEHDEAISIATKAFKKWTPNNKIQSQKIYDTSLKEYPDEFDIETAWDDVSHLSSGNFFVWGHDHEFGFGIKRKGYMGERHIEITSEAIALGFLPKSLNGKQLLNIGTNTGGDLFVLAGMGATCIALEENVHCANVVKFLSKSLGLKTEVQAVSAYFDREDWLRSFDYIYCSGVLYHVTDPVLLLRILFCYLKIGGELFIETKAETGRKGVCTYSGSVEKGGSWFAPDELTAGRWFIDAGFKNEDISIFVRSNGRLLVHAVKTSLSGLIEPQGFSRPGSWLENKN